MLYRAFVYTGHPLAESENTVFFETRDANPSAALQRLLAQTWGMPERAIESYNVFSEPELRANWGGVSERGADHDSVLLQTGDGPDGARHAEPERTMLLVSPRWHARLHAAQRHLARRKAEVMFRNACAEARALARDDMAPHLHGCLEPQARQPAGAPA